MKPKEYLILILLLIIPFLLFSTNGTNAEFKKYQKLSKAEKHIYNCTKDTQNFSGEDNNWKKITQKICLSEKINNK